MVADGQAPTVNELVHLVRELAESDMPLVYADPEACWMHVQCAGRWNKAHAGCRHAYEAAPILLRESATRISKTRADRPALARPLGAG